MKIMILSNMYPSGPHPGYGIFVFHQVEALKAHHDCRVTLVVSRATPGSLLGRFRKYLALQGRAWSRCLASFDVVHLHYVSSAHILAAAPILLRRKPLVVTAHRGDIYGLPRSGPRKILVSRLLRRARAVIAVSRDLKDRMVEDLGIQEERVSVINVGCDLTLFKPRSDAEIASLKQELGLTPGAFHILFVGALIRRKGLDTLFKALAGINTADRPTVVIVGAGPDQKALGSLASTLDIEESIRWLGERSHGELPDLYAVSDLFVLPSRSEGTPTVMLEAMASGTCAIVSRVGGVADVISHGRNGFLIDPEESDALRELIVQLMRDPQLRTRVARNGRADMEEHSLARQADRIAAIYRNALR